MARFRPIEKTFRGRLTAAGEVAEVFPLFSPEGERTWVPGWDPELLHPPDTVWCEGQIFRTHEDKGEAVWVVTRLDAARHEVRYHRVEPGRYVARIDVACRTSEGGGTEASVSYSFVGLSEDGNREIAAMTDEDYDAKMARWSRWIRSRFS